MGLQDTGTVDIISKPLPGDPCRLVLYVVDDGSVTDEIQRYELLVDKLVNYVNYVAGPAFRESYPGIGFSDVLVRVLCKTPPNDAMGDVQAIGAKGDAANRLKVTFADYDGFMTGLGSS